MRLNKLLLAAWVILILPIAGFAQSSTQDSLKQLLSTSLPDTTRIDILLKLSNLYQFENFQQSFSYVDQASALAEQIGTPNWRAKCNQQLGYTYTLSGNYTEALKYDNLSLENATLGKDTLLIGLAYNNIGNDYYDLGKYDEAYYYFTMAYSYANHMTDSLRMAISLHNVGRVFKELAQYGQAIDHLNLSRRISQLKHDEPGEPYFFNERGEIFLRMDQFDSARVLIQRAISLSKQLGLNELLPMVYSNAAKLSRRQGDYNRSLAYYDSTLSIYQKTNNTFGIALVNLGQGKVRLLENRFEEAEALTRQSLATAKTVNARVLEIEGYRTMYEIYEKQKDYKNAFDNFKQFKILEDSLFSQEMLQKLYRDQHRFDTESKDLQIAALSKQGEQQQDLLKREEFLRNILAVVFALSVILLITVYRSGQRRKEINKLLLTHQQETERRSEELERLNQVKDKFFSIISHDLRSPINALSGILDIMSKGGLTAEEFGMQTKELRIRFNHTRTLLNNLLDWTLLQMDKLSLQPAKINLRKIVSENVELLTNLQAKNIEIVNNVPEEAIGYADSNTINLVIRNLITNAIKFTNDGGVVTIGGAETSDEVTISVHDNGIGIKPEVLQILFDKTAPYTTRGTANEKGTGLGLILCKEFVEKNNGRIWVESKENQGSTFWFTVPKN